MNRYTLSVFITNLVAIMSLTMLAAIVVSLLWQLCLTLRKAWIERCPIPGWLKAVGGWLAFCIVVAAVMTLKQMK